MRFIRQKKIAAVISLVIVSACVYIVFASSAPPDYNTDVKPILNNKCITCHGGVKKQGGFSLLFESEALANTESGRPAIIPGDPAGSELIRRIKSKDPEERMPFEHEQLSDKEIDVLERWIKHGARWGRHWAYEPVQQPSLPESSGGFLGLFKKEDTWSRNDIDRFIRAQTEVNELKHSGEADSSTLLRRVSLDITGLPPSQSVAANYLDNNTEESYIELVDSLLASPAYGERWASVWLDLARYADTKGYERDGDRNIWKYRDWVIKAFNEDKPYDQFITEQLAGDLMPSANDEMLIATAFHRNTMTNDEGGTDNEEFRVAAVIDRVNTTWEVLLGTTFSCVQCHSHPYDPFKHEEYYSFMSFFNNTRDEDTYDEYPLLRHFDSVQTLQLGKLNDWLKRTGGETVARDKISFVKTWQPSINSIAADQFVNAELSDTKWLVFRKDGSARLPHVDLTGKTQLTFRYHGFVEEGTWQIRMDSSNGKLIASVSVPKTNERTIKTVPVTGTAGYHDLYLTYSSNRIFDRNATGILFDWFHFHDEFPGKADREYKEMQKIYQDLLQAKVPGTPVMQENRPDLKRKTFVFERGSWLLRGEEVSVGVPASLISFPEDAPKNRLGLAKWITSKQNPLTARTIVNRVWEQLYGTGLVETLDDLGSQGAVPTHRELLDHLSWKLMYDFNWSLKQLIKYIVLSSTYRQASKADAQSIEKDPVNRFYSRYPRQRLSAEQVRDQGLSASGLLHEKLYGPGVMPYQPEGIWLSPYSGSTWRLSTDGDQYRRAIYTFWKRTAPYPSMITFDAASREVCASRRIKTNTPLQALVTLNDEAYHEMARNLARRMLTHEDKLESQINFGYSSLLYKDLPLEKLQVLVSLYKQSLARLVELNKPALASDCTEEAMTIVATALLNLDEVLTKN